MSGKRVLITGPTGFIGLNLAKVLISQGHEVTALVRSCSSAAKVNRLKRLGARIVQAGLQDRSGLDEAVAGQEIIYHLAAVARAVKLESFSKVNLVGFANLMQSAIAAGGEAKIVFVSSLSAVGPSSPGRPHRENAMAKPISNYGKSKRAAEELAVQFSDRLNISIVRPPIVLGPHDSRGVEMFKMIDRWGINFNPSKRTSEYSIIHVADLCEALIAVAANGQSVSRRTPGAGIYFAAGDEIISYAQLGRIVGRALGKQSIVNLPLFHPVLRLVGGVNTLIGSIKGCPLFLNYDKVRDATAGSWACENEKLKAETGFQLSLSLAERISQTVHWYRNEGWLTPIPSHNSSPMSAGQNNHGSSNGTTMNMN